MTEICFYLKKNPDDLIRTMNEEMVEVVDWLQLNRLSLNLNKTHFILFRRKRIKTSLSEDLIINNIKTGMIERTKFLGVIIDQNLSCKATYCILREMWHAGLVFYIKADLILV